MPKIEELQIGQVGLRPSEIGVEATAAAARRGGQFFNQAAAAKEQTGHLLGRGLAAAGDAAVAIDAHREISTGAARGVQTYSNLMQSKDEVIKNLDPNDPAYGQQVDAAMKGWRETILADSLDKFNQGFYTEKGQAWAEHFIDQTRTQMSRESIADVANAAAIGVKNSVRATVNQASNAVVQNPTFSAIDAFVGTDNDPGLLDHTIGGVVDSSPMKGVAGAQVRTGLLEQAREKLVKDGALSAILKSNDPEATAAEFVRRYPKYINGAEALQLGQAAKRQNKQNGLTDYAAQEHERTLKIQQGTADLGQIYADNVTRDETGKPTINPNFFKQTQDLALRNPDVAEHVRVQQDWAEKQLASKKDNRPSDPATLQALYDGLFNADKPTTDIDLKKSNIAHMTGGKGINDHDQAKLDGLRKDLENTGTKGPAWQAAMKVVKEKLGTDPVGAEKYAQFVNAFMPAFKALPPEQRAGALDMDNKDSVISKVLATPGLKRSQMEIAISKASKGALSEEQIKNIAEKGGTIGGVKPTSIRAGGQTVEVPPKVDKAGYDALPSGAKFTAPDGSVRVKP